MLTASRLPGGERTGVTPATGATCSHPDLTRAWPRCGWTAVAVASRQAGRHRAGTVSPSAARAAGGRRGTCIGSTPVRRGARHPTVAACAPTARGLGTCGDLTAYWRPPRVVGSVGCWPTRAAWWSAAPTRDGGLLVGRGGPRRAAWSRSSLSTVACGRRGRGPARPWRPACPGRPGRPNDDRGGCAGATRRHRRRRSTRWPDGRQPAQSTLAALAARVAAELPALHGRRRPHVRPGVAAGLLGPAGAARDWIAGVACGGSSATSPDRRVQP